MPPEVILIISGYLIGYGAMHWYVLTRLGRVVPWAGARRIAGWALAAAGVVGPVAGRVAERLGAVEAGQWMLGVGLWWMGVVMVGAMGIGAVELVALGLGRARRWWVGWAGLGVGLVVMGWGWVQAGELTIRHISLTAGPGAYNLRLAFITDLHLGPPRGLGVLGPVERALARIKADMILCGGDVLDNPAPPQQWVRALSRIRAPLGVWAVSGNHERYMGIERSRRFMARAGWRVIDSQAWVVGGVVGLVGIGDERRGDCALERRLVRSLGMGVVVVLKHRPVVCRVGGVDLQLSGHTHGGQILPLGLGVWLVYRPLWGTTKAEDGRIVVVSRGCGTWGPPVRLWAPAEVWVVDLKGLTRRPEPDATAMVLEVRDR